MDITNLKGIKMKNRYGFLDKSFSKYAFYLAMTGLVSLGMWACGTDSNEPEATVKIETPANGSTVVGPNVKFRVSTTHFTFGKAPVGKVSAAQSDVMGGHIHVFLDKSAGVDANAITRLTQYDTTTLNITTAGLHYIIVEGGDSNHVDVESMHDSVQFTVTLP